jgi:outer membrane protein assembly factor BamD
MRHSLYVFLLLSLVACSSGPDEKNYSADELYTQAMEGMEDHNYEQAIKKFEKLQSRYPYGRYAQQAQMEIAYANYRQGEPAPALSAIERFLKQYPNNPHNDYMIYLKGLINFDENLSGVITTIAKQDPSERDPKSLRDAFDAFKDLVTRFPDSPYTPDAKLRMKYLLNTLANSDIHIASYYFRRGAYVAAVNRAKTILIDYPQTSQTRQALEIMVQSYNAMGMKELRDDAQRVLNQNRLKTEAAPIPQKLLTPLAPAAASGVAAGAAP